jgi:hypothetical protein
VQKVFTNQNTAVVGAVRTYLEDNDIRSQMRNEFSSSVMGEVAFFDVWPELWVADELSTLAIELISDVQKQENKGPDWLCLQCQESNPVNFELCWQCESVK